MARAFATLAAVFAIALMAASSAEARFFGADFRRPANSPATCQDFIFFQAVPSCSWSTTGSLGSTAETLQVPDTGVIRRVRVKTGPVTGPMRVSVARALRAENGGEAACCTGVRQTRVFTPQPNSVTTIRTRMRVRRSFNQVSRYYEFDVLFLSMQNSGTPIPAHYSGDTSGADNCSGGWFPRFQPGQENFSGPYGVCGYTILLRADWRRRN